MGQHQQENACLRNVCQTSKNAVVEQWEGPCRRCWAMSSSTQSNQCCTGSFAFDKDPSEVTGWAKGCTQDSLLDHYVHIKPTETFASMDVACLTSIVYGEEKCQTGWWSLWFTVLLWRQRETHEHDLDCLLTPLSSHLDCLSHHSCSCFYSMCNHDLL